MGFLVMEPADIEGSAVPAMFIGLFVAFGGVLFGYLHLVWPFAKD
jgi:hypothetical protein